MKHALVTMSVLVALTALPLRAAKRIEIRNTNLATGAFTKTVVLIDTGRIRFDFGERIIFFLTDGGERLVTLDRGRNEYRVQDQASIDAEKRLNLQLDAIRAKANELYLKSMTPERRAAAEKAAKERASQVPPKGGTPWVTRFVSKGAEKVNGFSCTNYDGVRDGRKEGEKVFEICEAPFAALQMSVVESTIVERMRDFAFRVNQLARDVGMGYLSEHGLTGSSIEEKVAGGFPVRATSFVDGKSMGRADLISVTTVDVSAIEFSTGTAKRIETPVPEIK